MTGSPVASNRVGFPHLVRPIAVAPAASTTMGSQGNRKRPAFNARSERAKVSRAHSRKMRHFPRRPGSRHELPRVGSRMHRAEQSLAPRLTVYLRPVWLGNQPAERLSEPPRGESSLSSSLGQGRIEGPVRLATLLASQRSDVNQYWLDRSAAGQTSCPPVDACVVLPPVSHRRSSPLLPPSAYATPRRLRRLSLDSGLRCFARPCRSPLPHGPWPALGSRCSSRTFSAPHGQPRE
jgi:hypothetical protein